MKPFLVKYRLYGVLLLLCAFYIYKATTFPIHDFANYYFGAQFLAEGNFNSSIYFPYEFNKAIADLGFQNIFVSYAPNTPFLAFFFLPLTLISVAKAKLIFNIISSLLFVFSCFRLFDFYKINSKYLLLLPLLFFVPIKNNLLFGQVYFLLFFLLTESLLTYEKQQFKKTGFFLSLAIVLKVFPILFVLLFVFKKQFKPLAYTFGICIFLFGISILFTGIDVWTFFLQSVLPKASNGEIANAFVDNYQSVFMFLKRLFVYEAVENTNAVLNNVKLFSGILLSVKFLLIVIGYFITKKENNLIAFSYWVLASFLISPYGATYGFILLIFVLISVLKSSLSNIQKGIFILLLFLINNLPLSYFIENHFPFSYLRLFLLLLLFFSFLSVFRNSIQWKVILPSVILPLLFVFLFKKQEHVQSQPLFSEKQPILIYDYKIANNKLIYFYWDENGANEKNMDIKINTWKELNLENQQIFHNEKQLTSDKNNKLKPILINDKEVIFLSDENRGIGFYIFRKIKIN